MLVSDFSFSIALRGVSVKFGDRVAVQDVSLDIPEGQRVALVGPSGCGKTTLLRALSGNVPSLGTIVRRGRVSVVYQDLKLLPWLTVEENIFISKSTATTTDDNTVRRWIAVAGLDGKLANYPYQLSGGQQQRVSVIRALVQKPDILLLDEPFSALDFVAKRRLIKLIDSIADLAKLTIVVVSHDLDDALSLAKRILVMREGQLVADLENGSPGNAELRRLQAEIRSLFEREMQL